MARNFIPRTDGDFNAWFRNFCDRIIANPATYGVSPEDLAALQAVYTDWLLKYPKHITDQTTARASAGDKDNSRDAAESVGRRLARLIQARMGTTNAQRGELNITVPDLVKTTLSEQIVLETPAPVIQVKCTASKTVRIDWYPSQTEGQSEALPKGIDGLALWLAEMPLGGSPADIPADKKQWRFLAMDTNSPYIHNVGNSSTVTLAYKAQWFDKKMRMGPFCQPVIVAVTP